MKLILETTKKDDLFVATCLEEPLSFESTDEEEAIISLLGLLHDKLWMRKYKGPENE